MYTRITQQKAQEWKGKMGEQQWILKKGICFIWYFENESTVECSYELELKSGSESQKTDIINLLIMIFKEVRKRRGTRECKSVHLKTENHESYTPSICHPKNILTRRNVTPLWAQNTKCMCMGWKNKLVAASIIQGPISFYLTYIL